MLLGHTTFSEQAFQDARLDAVHNIEFVEAGNVPSYEATFSIGTETVSGSAPVDLTGTDLVATFSIGDETAFGEAFQNLITLSVNDVDLTLWNETDDSETSSWTEVDDSQTVDWTEVDDSQTASWTKID
jgi:hypothetical protein